MSALSDSDKLQEMTYRIELSRDGENYIAEVYDHARQMIRQIKAVTKEDAKQLATTFVESRPDWTSIEIIPLSN